VTVKQLAQALGYSDQKPLSKLITRNSSEFEGKVQYVKLTYCSGGRPDQLLNFDGVILAMVFAKTKKAVKS